MYLNLFLSLLGTFLASGKKQGERNGRAYNKLRCLLACYIEHRAAQTLAKKDGLWRSTQKIKPLVLVKTIGAAVRRMTSVY